MTKKDLVKKNAGLPAGDRDAALAHIYGQQLEEQGKRTNKYKMFRSISAQHGIKNPKFEIEGNDDSETVTGVIVNYEILKEYREDPNDPAPTCASVGGKFGTLFGPCKKCEYGQWGDVNGKPTKECKDYKKLLIVAQGMLEDSPEGEEGLFEMKLSPTSNKNFNEFEKKITKEEKVPMACAIVELGLETQKAAGRKPWSVTTFTYKGTIQESKDKEFVEAAQSATLKCYDIFDLTPETAPANAPEKKSLEAPSNDDDDIEDAEISDVMEDEIPF